MKPSPFHPQTGRLVERFNGTLKSMLRKAATEEGMDWDKLIPTCCSRTGRSLKLRQVSRELMYGQPVRGPLDVLKEEWKPSKRASESIVSYVLVHEKLEKMSVIVQQNMEKVQKVQKTWYDKNARQRELKEGDEVLVLLPSSSNKLLASWQGPCPVKRRFSEVTYEVDMTDKQKRKCIFHVNMLKKWVRPKAEVCRLAEETSPIEGYEEECLPLWEGGAQQKHDQDEASINSQLRKVN